MIKKGELAMVLRFVNDNVTAVVGTATSVTIYAVLVVGKRLTKNGTWSCAPCSSTFKSTDVVKLVDLAPHKLRAQVREELTRIMGKPESPPSDYPALQDVIEAAWRQACPKPPKPKTGVRKLVPAGRINSDEDEEQAGEM